MTDANNTSVNLEYAQAFAPPTHISNTPLARTSFFDLPRELRDEIYNHAFVDALLREPQRIERWQLRYFTPTPAGILSLLHHHKILINRQVAEEALEVLFKKHTVLLSCGPFVLKTILMRIEQDGGSEGIKWLNWLNHIDIDWVTFPILRYYPPYDASQNQVLHASTFDGENDSIEVDTQYVFGLSKEDIGPHYTDDDGDYDWSGGRYDDNFAGGADLYPTYSQHQTTNQIPTNDPFGFSTHYPWQNTSEDDLTPTDYTLAKADVHEKLNLLIQLEVTPLFQYFSSPAMSLKSITLPLVFLSKDQYHRHSTSLGGYTPFPRHQFWIEMAIHALMLLRPVTPSTAPKLDELRVRYVPKDLWATANPCDDLEKLAREGIWYHEDDKPYEKLAFNLVGDGLWERDAGIERDELDVSVTLIKAPDDILDGTVGDELEVVFRRAGENQVGA